MIKESKKQTYGDISGSKAAMMHSYQWLSISASLQYLQCISIGDTAVLHQTVYIYIYISMYSWIDLTVSICYLPGLYSNINKNISPKEVQKSKNNISPYVVPQHYQNKDNSLKSKWKPFYSYNYMKITYKFKRHGNLSGLFDFYMNDARNLYHWYL